jgi:hypothetical protein
MYYGVNYVYFVVNAANWAHSWLPSFQFDATNITASTVLAVDWAYPDESSTGVAVWNTTTAAGNIYTADNPVLPHPGNASGTGVDENGECIIVRVTVDHNLNETLLDIVIDFAVDGFMYDQVAANYTNPLLGDIHYTDGGAGNPCPWYDGYVNDAVQYTLTQRPEVIDATLPTPPYFLPTDSE